MEERIKENYQKFYDILELIGNGAIAYVYKGKDKKTQELRAIKVMRLDKIREKLINECEPKEVENKLKYYIGLFIEEYNIMKLCSYNNKYSVSC